MESAEFIHRQLTVELTHAERLIDERDATIMFLNAMIVELERTIDRMGALIAKQEPVAFTNKDKR